ncbi:TPA: hypothetical protein JAW44_004590 [Citrobacter werkmanii]|uniref:Uncharacterized protein n=1 Tax=Citrobacter werkmanii TaxID=67827 RepID=A0AA37ZCA1_9ENTR|nr:hypothetical protein [Citrobacter werkmanii]
MDTNSHEDEKPLLAYSVQGYEYGCVVFARSNVVARRNGANELGIEFGQVTSCRRMPELDKYAGEHKVPMKVLIEEFGWWQECTYCSSMVSAEGHKERVWDGQSIFCDKECQQNHQAQEERWRQERVEAAEKLAEVKQIALTRFPGITNVHAYKEWDEGHRVYFNFPGGKRSASWLVGSENINVSECDVEAGKEYMEKVRASQCPERNTPALQKLLTPAINKFLAIRRSTSL